MARRGHLASLGSAVAIAIIASRQLQVKFLQLLKVPKASKEPPQKKAKVEEDSPPRNARCHPVMAWKGWTWEISDDF